MGDTICTTTTEFLPVCDKYVRIAQLSLHQPGISKLTITHYSHGVMVFPPASTLAFGIEIYLNQSTTKQNNTLWNIYLNQAIDNKRNTL